MNALADQMTSSTADHVTRSVQDDGTIVWRRECPNGNVETKRLIVDASGKIIGATWSA